MSILVRIPSSKVLETLHEQSGGEQKGSSEADFGRDIFKTSSEKKLREVILAERSDAWLISNEPGAKNAEWFKDVEISQTGAAREMDFSKSGGPISSAVLDLLSQLAAEGEHRRAIFPDLY